MKRFIIKIFFLTCICIVIPKTLVIATETSNTSNTNSTQEAIQEQKEEFGIQDFINNSKEYASGEFFENIDIGEILDQAIQGNVDNNRILKAILNLLGIEIFDSIKAIVSILVIIVIHSLLKSISESLENDGIAKTNILCSIHTDCDNCNVKFFRNNNNGKTNNNRFSSIYEYACSTFNYSNDVYRKYYNKWNNRTNHIIYD